MILYSISSVTKFVNKLILDLKNGSADSKVECFKSEQQTVKNVLSSLSKISLNQSLLTGCGSLEMGKQKNWALGICVYILYISTT